ncbi:LysR family transcriptional regulator [Tissierella pigra]|uniref:winged helix-turn-helix domain-containing protein n=1 Tax=Tissierella pigra TaxID=2607614 RepID=UPI001C11122A|nr:LysR family transcriptional regulator [Tissierella pigra]MBU5425165.1 LysR family transcriptional regulator [Tissierella pigra]
MSNNFNDKLDYHIKVTIFLNDSIFGPGIAKIMELVKDTNSLSEAYRIMGLSSSKGWKIIKKAEESLGFPLFITTRGGSGGGKSQLSKEGEELLNKYETFISKLNIEGDKLFKEIFLNNK